MQPSKTETFQELIRRLVSVSADIPAASVDSLELTIDQNRPAIDSINEDELDRAPDDSAVFDRNADIASGPSALFASEPPSVAHPASIHSVSHPSAFDFCSVAHTVNQQEILPDPPERHDDHRWRSVENREGALASGVGPTSSRDVDATLADLSLSIIQHRDERPDASTLRSIDDLTHSQVPGEKQLSDHAVARPLPVIEPGESQVEALAERGPPGDDILDSARSEARDTQQVIDDLAVRVAQLETAQFIRGRL